jgi:hypothetical protein
VKTLIDSAMTPCTNKNQTKKIVAVNRNREGKGVRVHVNAVLHGLPDWGFRPGDIGGEVWISRGVAAARQRHTLSQPIFVGS